MLKGIEIYNFRSIKKTNISLGRTFTVVIGENGSGKTTLILALRFISNLLQYGPSRAVQLSGGISHVFHYNKARRSSDCRFKLVIGNSSKLKEDWQTDFKEITYEICIGFDSGSQQIVVKKEYLFVDHKEVIIQEKQRNELDLFYLGSRFMPPSRHGIDYKKDRHLLSGLYSYLTSMHDFNVKPSALREPGDILEDFKLSYEGGGFSEILYYIFGKKRLRLGNRSNLRKLSRRRAKVQEILLDEIEESLDFIDEINAVEDIDSTLVHTKFVESHSRKEFSVSQMSDGTLKSVFIAMIAIIAPYSILCIEELENYLHPKVIRSLLKLLKEQSLESNYQIILTTHSETILNQCEAKDLLISVRGDEGSSRYIRPKNIETLQNELEAGGFGLGTYWSEHGGIVS